jgi:hypothetical protein
MANFRNYTVLTRIITTFSIKTNVINTYVNGHIIDTSPTLTREWVSEWSLFNANSAIVQLYHDAEKKLIFKEMIMMSALY